MYKTILGSEIRRKRAEGNGDLQSLVITCLTIRLQKEEGRAKNGSCKGGE